MWNISGGAFHDMRHDTEAKSVDGLDDALGAAVVADGLARVFDAAVERRRRDVAVAPDAIEQLVLRDEPVAAGEEVREHLEDLWLDVQPLTGATELVRACVELVLAEGVDHADGRGGGHLNRTGARGQRRSVDVDARARQE
jgi:hypothetical protein